MKTRTNHAPLPVSLDIYTPSAWTVEETTLGEPNLNHMKHIKQLIIMGLIFLAAGIVLDILCRAGTFCPQNLIY